MYDLSRALDDEVREIDTLTGSDGDFDEVDNGSFTLSDNATIDRGGASDTIFMMRY